MFRNVCQTNFFGENCDVKKWGKGFSLNVKMTLSVKKSVWRFPLNPLTILNLEANSSNDRVGLRTDATEQCRNFLIFRLHHLRIRTSQFFRGKL